MSQIEMRDQHFQYALNLWILPIEMSFYVKKNLLGAGLFEFVRTERMVSKYHIKICSKNNLEEEWNSLTIMNRNTLQQTQVYEISVCA